MSGFIREEMEKLEETFGGGTAPDLAQFADDLRTAEGRVEATKTEGAQPAPDPATAYSNFEPYREFARRPGE